ncbi:Spc24 subunit of Ndc80-domain-containing protein [Scheffersomyces xylosifermentans]|uniref:Spc24 subunit of Ndc80-domain-containing protein n=1 Tax=Scheffersomyces xylosifermentans TaxID=1304137 RepID=UPI00315D0982
MTPEEIIDQAIESIEIDPELLTLDRIEETIRDIQRIRDDKIARLTEANQELQVTVKRLNHELSLLIKISDYNYDIIRNLTQVADHHGGEIRKSDNIFVALNKKSIELDNIKVSIAKNLNDLESSINLLKLNKSKLQKNLEELKVKIANLFNDPFDDRNREKSTNEEDLLNQDSSILKISLYRNLGVRIENFNEDSKADEETANDHIIIHNKEKNLTSVFKVEPKYSDYFISNYIWDRVEGYN